MAPFSPNDQADISVDISPDGNGALRKIVVLPGINEQDRPLYKDNVIVEYSGFFESGECFATKQKYSFSLGTGEVIKAWDIGIATMILGEVALFHCISDYAYGITGLPPLIPPSSNLIFEIDLISFKGEDLTKCKNQGIQLSIVSVGTANEKPLYGASCIVDIVGWCVNGKEFLNVNDWLVTLDNSNESSFIPAIEKAIKKSNIGQVSLVKVTPKYGYNTNCVPTFILKDNLQENAIQYFRLTLVSCEQVRQHWEMTVDELLQNATDFKELGTEIFKNGRYEEAHCKYKRCLFLLDSIHDSESDDARTQRDHLKLCAHLNLSICHLKMGNFLRAFNEADVALQIQPDSIKAHYRRAMAHCELSNYSEAIGDLSFVLKKNPRNKEALDQLKICQAKFKDDKSEKQAIFFGMFNKFKEFDKKQEQSDGASGDVFSMVGEWNNEMASGMLSLEQEMEAFKYDDDDDDDDATFPPIQHDDEDDEQFLINNIKISN